MSALVDLSNDLARAVERAARAVVAVHGRPELASTGVHWRPGVLVTADHTVTAEEEITVATPDGRTVPARLVGRDATTDLAVLRAEGLDLPVAELAEPAVLRVGHLVLAVGYGPRVSWGVVSALGRGGRAAPAGDRDQILQLDLTLYPGFSGGPLVDVEGRVVGLNTSGRSRSFRGAIPAAVVARVVDEIVARGRVSRGYLGVALQPVHLPEETRRALPVAGEFGLIVVSVEPGGPAASAGLVLGDVLVALDEQALREPGDVQAAVASRPVGATVAATLLRGGAPRSIAVTVGERPTRRR